MREIYLCELCKSNAGYINLYCINFTAPYVIMHETLKHIIKRPILANSYNFFTHIKMLLYLNYMYLASRCINHVWNRKALPSYISVWTPTWVSPQYWEMPEGYCWRSAVWCSSKILTSNHTSRSTGSSVQYPYNSCNEKIEAKYY